MRVSSLTTYSSVSSKLLVEVQHWSFHIRETAKMRVFDRCTSPLSILLLAAIGAKLIDLHGGLQVDKHKGN